MPSLHEVAAMTTCKHCGHKFVGPLALLIVDPTSRNGNNGRVTRLILQLVQHLIEKHPEQEGNLQASAIGYLGMLRMTQFETSDPDLLNVLEQMRSNVHTSTRKHSIPDDRINARCEELASKLIDLSWRVPYVLKESEERDEPARRQQAVKNELVKLFTSIRDMYEELPASAQTPETPH